MLAQPCGHGMVDRDLDPQPSLDAAPQRPEVASEVLHAYLGHPVGLALIALRMLLADSLEVLDVNLHLRTRLCEHLLDGWLVVAF